MGFLAVEFTGETIDAASLWSARSCAFPLHCVLSIQT